MRDLTDSEQHRRVLDLASRLVGDPSASVETTEAAEDVEHTEHTECAAVLAEARAVARSRRRLAEAVGDGAPVHLSVVWAMYGETGRIVPRTEHPHGEDFLREKVRQLDWLTAGLPVTWSIVACDDGCPETPSSAEVMASIIAAEGWPSSGPGSVRVIRLADVLADVAQGRTWIGPGFDRLTSTDGSRKGGSILAALHTAILTAIHTALADHPKPAARQLVCYTDADLSANLGQLGALVAPIVAGATDTTDTTASPVVAALGQRYGMHGAVLVRADGPSTEPQSTGGKPDKLIILFRHFVRALLLPDLAHVLDTQAGFKAFDAAALAPELARMCSFDESFDVELLIHLAQAHGAAALAVEPIVFTEDFAATNFPSVDPGPRHLAMIRQVVALYDRFVAPLAPATGEAAELLELVRGLDLDGYVRLIEALRAEDAGDPTLFDRRWPVGRLRSLLA